MSEPWTEDIERLTGRLASLIERADSSHEARELAAEALEEFAVIVEEIQAQNSELAVSRSALEHERERFRELFETVPDGYLVTDDRGLIQEVNATATSLFERSRSRLIGKPLASLVDVDDRPAFYTQLARIHHKGPGSHLSINLMVVDGSPIPANLRATVSRSRGDGRLEIRWLIHDRRPGLEARDLRLSEERLRGLFAAVAVGIVLADERGVLMFSNRLADRLLGRGDNDVAQDDWLAATHPEDVALVTEALRSAREHGEPDALRHRLVRANGDTAWVDHGITPYRNPSGGLAGSISTFNDVTAEYLAGIALQRSRDFTNTVIDTVAALVIVLDPNGRIRTFNHACVATTGFPAQEMVGEDVLETLVPLDQREDLRRAFDRLADEGLPIAHENDWVTADGDRRTIAWTSTTLVAPDGTVEVVIGTGLDVTETRALEERMAQTQRLESIGRLAAGIAHDFNNTLAALQLRLQRIDKRCVDDDATRVDLAAAQTTIDRTKHVIADLLAFGQRQRLVETDVDVNDEIQRVSAMLADLVGGEITIGLELTDDDTTTVLDAARFEQSLTNLVLNARDAMPDGGDITVTTSIDRAVSDSATAGSAEMSGALSPGDYIRVSVSDTGAGIDSIALPHVFEPYFTTKPPSRGTGLGLSTTHGSVIQGGGAIAIDSQPGRGATITMWLPLRASPDVVRTPAYSGPGDGRVALVVEDDADMREVLVEALREKGFRTLDAPSGEHALGLLGTSIDVLVTDVQLPGIDGFEVARRFAAAHPAIEAVYISGAAQHTLDALLPDEATIISKPFAIEQLLVAMGHDGRGARRN